MSAVTMTLVFPVTCPGSGDLLVSVSGAERLEDVTECQPICYVQQNEGAGEQDPRHSVLEHNRVLVASLFQAGCV